MRTVTIELYRFSELPRDVQDTIAARWINLTLAYGDPNGDNEVDLRYARECLMTEPDEKYTAEGYEMHIAVQV